MARCRVTGGMARYEVLDFRPGEGYAWEARVARFARDAAEAGKRVRVGPDHVGPVPGWAEGRSDE